jgi:hypothetical protein
MTFEKQTLGEKDQVEQRRGTVMTQGKDAERQLASFIAKFTPEVAALAGDILGEMRKLYPAALELVYDNYNALAIGFGPTERASEAVFSIAVFPRWVSLFFLQAKGLPDPDKMLRGNGKVARHIVLPSAATLYQPPVRELMREAAMRAKVPIDPKNEHRLIIKSISPTQKPRRPSSTSAKASARAGSTSMKKRVRAGGL